MSAGVAAPPRVGAGVALCHLLRYPLPVAPPLRQADPKGLTDDWGLCRSAHQCVVYLCARIGGDTPSHNGTGLLLWWVLPEHLQGAATSVGMGRRAATSDTWAAALPA